MLDLRQLGECIGELHTHDLFRLETLPYYDAASDDQDYHRYLAGEDAPNAAAKQPWLDRLRADTAAGRRWRRLHLVQSPLSDYLRYECEWGYTFNVANGEDVRILGLDADAEQQRAAHLGDFFVIDYRHVILSRYSDDGRFLGAELLPDGSEDAKARRLVADALWAIAEPFTDWWAAHPEFHRDHQAV